MLKTEVKEIVENITKQIETYKNTGTVDELAVVPVSSDYADKNGKVCIKLRNERYYIAYSKEVTKPISVLWSDMDFIRKNFGIMRYDGNNVLPSTDPIRFNSPVTFLSLNRSRLQNLSDYRKAIELNVCYHEVVDNLLEDGTFGTYESKDDFGRKVMIQRVPSKPTKAMKKGYQKEVDRGLYVICKFVGQVELGFSV